MESQQFDEGGWLAVASWQLDAVGLRLRLLPDHHDPKRPDPVVLVHVTGLRDPHTCETSLGRLAQEWVLGLEVTGGSLAIAREFDDDLLLEGESVSISRGPYSSTELLQIIELKEREITSLHGAVDRMRAALDSVTRYLDGLVQRAEAKRSLTTRSTVALDHELDVLHRIRNRLEPGEPQVPADG